MSRGYTLIELMLVCTLVFIVCAISIPTFFNKPNYDLDNELSKLEVIFTYLQQRARATNQTQTATIDIKNNCVTWNRNGKQASHTLAQTLQFGFLSGSHGPPANPTGPIVQAITFVKGGSQVLAWDDKKSEPPFVEFFSNGKISSGSIYITDKKQQIMGALTLGVSQVSYIRRYVYQSKQWIVRK